MEAFDAVIVGAGPSGATVALNLAPFRRVLLVDRWAAPRDRVGESLPGASRRLLVDMGLWEGFLADAPAPSQVYRGAWGEASPVERHALANPDGLGWRLDRLRFERRLRATAMARGAILRAPSRPVGLRRDGETWLLRLDHDGVTRDIQARLIIDASGRGSRLLADHGAERRIDDRLVCAWLRAKTDLPEGVVQIEAEAQGWWYATPLAHGQSLLALHTDADLPPARLARDGVGLLARARSLPMLSSLLDDPSWDAAAKDRAARGYCAAHGAWLSSPVGPGWLAVGDAALAFDPLSSQGLFNALYTGLAGAETADRLLSGQAEAASEYVEDLVRVRAAYVRHLEAWYGLEARWSEQSFWRRRQGMTPRRDLRRGETTSGPVSRAVVPDVEPRS